MLIIDCPSRIMYKGDVIMPKYKPAKEKQDVNVRVEWNNDDRGQFSGHNDLMIGFDSPLAFGGKGNNTYPDELFLGAITSCFITTFISIIRRFGEEEMTLDIISLETKSSLLRSKNYISDEINITGKIIFTYAEDPALVRRCIILSRKNCHIIASINPGIAIKINIELTIKENEDGESLKEEVLISGVENS